MSAARRQASTAPRISPPGGLQPSRRDFSWELAIAEQIGLAVVRKMREQMNETGEIRKAE